MSNDFLEVEVITLENQLEIHTIDVRSSIEFNDLEGINGLAMKLVRTRRNILHPLVYRLIL